MSSKERERENLFDSGLYKLTNFIAALIARQNFVSIFKKSNNRSRLRLCNAYGNILRHYVRERERECRAYAAGFTFVLNEQKMLFDCPYRGLTTSANEFPQHLLSCSKKYAIQNVYKMADLL